MSSTEPEESCPPLFGCVSVRSVFFFAVSKVRREFEKLDICYAEKMKNVFLGVMGTSQLRESPRHYMIFLTVARGRNAHFIKLVRIIFSKIFSQAS
jgi:hypothetical protein